MIVAGVIVLLLAVGCGWLARLFNRRLNRIESTERTTVKELRALRQAAAEAAGEGHFRYHCEIVGAARPHKNGPLTSELGKKKCVWHHHRVTRRYEEAYRDSDGNRKHRTRHEVVSEHSSATAFFVEDETGKLVVRPGEHRLTGVDKTLDRFDRHRGSGAGSLSIGPLRIDTGGSGTIGFQQQEWTLPAGRRVFLQGEVSDVDGRLEFGPPREEGVFIISAKSRDEVVRDENRKVLAFGFASGAAVLAGVTLLALGFLG
ncbi:GIDE domain-containing protein [Streptomyces sp. NPDC005438]|uniref:GIDE domain-containing protein n=1 Tax=Streptomyces sp. NPDC005438 TaxID=3156880 RepID=UPI0033B45B6C